MRRPAQSSPADSGPHENPKSDSTEGRYKYESEQSSIHRVLSTEARSWKASSASCHESHGVSLHARQATPIRKPTPELKLVIRLPAWEWLLHTLPGLLRFVCWLCGRGAAPSPSTQADHLAPLGLPPLSDVAKDSPFANFKQAL